jgi:hypothetical protein
MGYFSCQQNEGETSLSDLKWKSQRIKVQRLSSGFPNIFLKPRASPWISFPKSFYFSQTLDESLCFMFCEFLVSDLGAEKIHFVKIIFVISTSGRINLVFPLGETQKEKS